MKSVYALQPYHGGGNKKSKSLVLVIPVEAARECNIDTSTIFALHIDQKTKRILIQSIAKPEEAGAIESVV